MNKPLRFNIELGRTKPVNIRNEQVRCPFCDRSKLTDILDTSGHIIWLMNKYPVLEKTWPTVIIETETDEASFLPYLLTKQHTSCNSASISGVKLVNARSLNPYYSLKTMAICLADPFAIHTAKSSV